MFMKSSIVYAVTWRTFVRFQTMIWPSIEFKKSFDIFWPQLEKKTLWRIFRIFRPNIGCKKKPFERYSCLEFILKNSKHVENLQVFIHDSGFPGHFSLNIYMSSWINIVVLLNVSLSYIIFLSWLFVKISFLSLFRSLLSVNEHRMQEQSKCRVYQIFKTRNGEWGIFKSGNL